MKDTAFIRGKVPMTKEEVRSIVLSKLELRPTDVVLDVGAGTGSVSIEASQQLPRGKVIAIEHNIEAVDLIHQNIQKHNINNIEVVHAKAPEGMNNLSEVDKVFIGGSGGNLNTILSLISENGKEDVTIVVTAIVLDTMMKAYQFFSKNDFDFELIQVAVNKVDTTKKVAMLLAQNPIFILTAKHKK